MKKIILFIIAALILTAAGPAMADIIVKGQACPFFAGQTSPITAPSPWVPTDYFGDLTDSDTIPPFVDVTGFGGTISIAASGTWGHGPGLTSGPDGYSGSDPTHPQYEAFGISAIDNSNLNALIGVFLTDNAPDASLTPARLMVGTSDMTNPLLQQGFYIGSSLSGINIPGGATRLFFGLNNGYEWTNNVGELCVTVVPIPGAVLLGMLGLSVTGFKLRKHA